MSRTNEPDNEARNDDVICGLTADERQVLRAGLDALPDTMPPRVVWHRIREQAEAEGLLQRKGGRRYRHWYAGAGLVAAAALLAVLVPSPQRVIEPEFSAVPDNRTVSNISPPSALDALMVESRQLEDDLRSLPAEPRVVRVGTQATILELEDRIAAIDYQLSDPTVRLSETDREVFWRERVRLMKSLVRLRYAQTQAATF
jgi:hypothetical protein